MSGEGEPSDGGLASRISKPESSSTSWADEVNSPSNAQPPSSSLDEATSKLSVQADDDKEKAVPQMDGATEPFGGSELHEPDYEVEIKLADMQADPNNPLYSAASFDQLGL
jgi:ATP-dependent RNA helicase DDX19/DBP5